MTTKDCTNTVTGIRARCDCYLGQLKLYCLPLHTILQTMIPLIGRHDISRLEISKIIKHPNSRKKFQTLLNTRCPDICHVIFKVLLAYSRLVGIDISATSSTNFVSGLYNFLTQLIYERPIILRNDTVEGTYVGYLRSQIIDFIYYQLSMYSTKL